MGIEAEPGSQSKLYGMMGGRGIKAFATLGGHDIVCRLPGFRDLKKFRNIVDSVLFITEGGRAIVANTTTYIILDELRKETQEKPSAFCFIRSGKLPSRHYFDRTIQCLYGLSDVLAVSVTIGFLTLFAKFVRRRSQI